VAHDLRGPLSIALSLACLPPVTGPYCTDEFRLMA
jgi:hypothetical protein